MLYAYAATKPEATADGLEGIDRAPVEMLPMASVGLAVSRHAAAPEVTGPNLSAHHQVALALAMQAGAVPFRFGNVFVDEALLHREIDARAGDLATKLVHVAGCVEVTLRLHPKVGIRSSESRPGTAYLLGKKERMAAEERLRETLGSLVKDWRRSQKGSEVRLACLLPAGKVNELRQRVAGQAALTGPWAPSSFV